jgi:hypothetical protein
VSYAPADRETVMDEFADLVISLIGDDKPVLVTAEQLGRWSRAFEADVSEADSHRVHQLLARIHARLAAIFELTATDGCMPVHAWISLDRASPRFVITEVPADTESVTQ